jgi:hypothetical protein
MSTKQMLQREFCRVIEICSSVNTHKHLCTEAHDESTIYSMGLVALECPGSCSQTFIFPHLIFRPVFCCFSEWISSCQCKQSATLWWTNFHFYSLINGGSFYFLLVHKANYVSYGSCQRCCLWMSLEQSMSLKRLLLE